MAIFDTIKVRPPKRHRHKLTHANLMTTDFARLTPIYLEDVVPGDVFRVGAELRTKFQPLLAPVMGRCRARVDFFFVPNRIIWNDWEQFITGGPDGTAAPIPPYYDMSSMQSILDNKGLSTDPLDAGKNINLFGKSSLADYFHLPVNMASRNGSRCRMKISALPFHAYRKIWNDWYRDQNLHPEEWFIDKGSGLMSTTDFRNCYLRERCWRKDMFTSALPFLQRGPEAVVNVGGVVPVSDSTGHEGVTGSADYELMSVNPGQHTPAWFKKDSEGFVTEQYGNEGSRYDINHTHNLPPLEADLAEASGISVNELRRLTSVQRFLELAARAGGRYVEQIMAYFGTRVPDYRLDRSEWIGGGSSDVIISDVWQSSQTTEDSNLGQFAGHADSATFATSKKYKVDEHGWIIGILNFMPETLYEGAVERKWTRENRFDYFWPQFQHLGEQSVKLKELYGWTTEQEGDNDFGYQRRYVEYCYHPSHFCGEFHDTLDYWHFGRKFGEAPSLSNDFLLPDVQEMDRIFPVISDIDGLTDHINVECLVHVHAKRPIMRDATPSLI